MTPDAFCFTQLTNAIVSLFVWSKYVGMSVSNIGPTGMGLGDQAHRLTTHERYGDSALSGCPADGSPM